VETNQNPEYAPPIINKGKKHQIRAKVKQHTISQTSEYCKQNFQHEFTNKISTLYKLKGKKSNFADNIVVVFCTMAP